MYVPDKSKCYIQFGADVVVLVKPDCHGSTLCS